MQIIRTVFRPWEEVEVSDAEAASMESMGLLSQTGSVEPGPGAEPDPPLASAPAVADEPPPKSGRTAKTATTAPAEEVNTDGSSEEGGQETGTRQEG